MKARKFFSSGWLQYVAVCMTLARDGEAWGLVRGQSGLQEHVSPWYQSQKNNIIVFFAVNYRIFIDALMI